MYSQQKNLRYLGGIEIKIILEPKTFDKWKTETDIDEYHKQNTEVYDFTDEEYEEFIEVIKDENN